MRRSFLLVVAAICLLAPTAALAQAETPKLENLIPEHSFLVVSVNDVADTGAQCSRSAMGKLWNEPEVQQFFAPGLKMLKREIKKLERQVGHPITGLLEFLQGQVAFSIVEFDPMTMGMIPDAVLLVDLGEKREEFQALHEDFLEKYGAHMGVEDLEYKGVAYQSFAVDMGVEIYAGYLGNALVITTLPDRMTSMIDRWKEGGGSSLATNPTYVAVDRKVGGPSAFFSVYFNVRSVMDTFGDMMDPEMSRVVDETGLGSIQALGYGAGFVGEGVRDTFYVHVPGEKKGLMKLMYTAPAEATQLLSRVPKNAFYACAFGLDMNAVGETALELVGKLQPYALDQVEGMISQAEDFLGLDIREDILKAFGAAHAMYAAFPEGGGLVPDLVYLSKLRQPERFMESMGQVVSKLKMFLEDSPKYTVNLRQMSYMGKTIYYIYVTHKWGDPFPVTPACVLDGDVMAFALLPNTLKDWVARGGGAPSILERPDFVRARQGIPEDLDGVEYLDFGAGIRLLYGTLAPLAQMFGKAENCPVDMALLPRTETIAKHFFGGIWGAKAGDDGLAVYAYSPTGMLPMMVAGGAAAAGVFLLSSGQEVAFRAGPVGPTREVEDAPARAPVAPEPPAVKPPQPEPVRLRGAKAALEEIYIGLLFHSAQADEYPKDLGELVKSKALEGAGALLLAGDDSAPMVGGYPCSFVYVGPAVGDVIENAGQAVWVYSRDGIGGGMRWVLLASGEVKHLPEAEFQKLLSGTEEMLRGK